MRGVLIQDAGCNAQDMPSKVISWGQKPEISRTKQVECTRYLTTAGIGRCPVNITPILHLWTRDYRSAPFQSIWYTLWACWRMLWEPCSRQPLYHGRKRCHVDLLVLMPSWLIHQAAIGPVAYWHAPPKVPHPHWALHDPYTWSCD